MNIALFDATKYWSGGSERVYLCAKGFKEKGHNVTVVCLRTSRLNKLLHGKVKIYNVHPVFDLDPIAGLAMLYILVKNKIDIIDIHSPKFYWLGVYLGRLLHKKVFITRNVAYRKKGVKALINKYFLYKICNGVICISNKIMDGMIKDFGLAKNKIKVIYGEPGLLSISSLKNIRTYYSIAEQAIVLSIIGRIEKNKGQDFAIKVLRGLINKKYDSKLFIIGPFEDKKFYQKLTMLVKELNLTDRVIFTGFISNVGDYIYSSDIVLCCSLYEGIPRAIVESLLIYTPVVATDTVRKDEIPLSQEYLDLLYIVDRNVDKFVDTIEYILKIHSKKDKIFNINLQNIKFDDGITERLAFYTSV